ncbi:HD-GYP domain-containing protein [Cellvibrio fibrivorans]|uniref:HD-GYP domain-containing protein n=1 Tax=Cellvibrio fibrivorans TaxID=126350 RepID=A0ABU1UYH3_9GAMM|nr:HD domain-containing phosphohydrolase [Cellvibrio fibrivorans]MDR7090252.1 hypothetical protein [Cellvibrio fibrivorans]
MIDNEQKNYCANLVEVNKKQDVITNQAIYNQQGVLLLSEGSRLDEKRSQILLQHKLMKPLEQCVGIATSMDARTLFDYLNKFAKNLPGLYAVTDNEGYQKTLRLVCLFYEKFPLLRQNLTVLALRARHIYFHGIFSALAGVAIARKLNLSLPDIQATFIAGLFHDVGFLYLEPHLLEKSHSFSADEWKALQAHPLIAQRFLGMVPGLPKEIGIAIIDHHERIDGTGYPRHVFGDKISMVSQIIAATDHIIFNHSRYQDYGVHAHSMLLAALKLSDNIYFESVYNAATILFKEAPPPTETLLQLPSIELLLARQRKLRIQFESAKSLAQQLFINSKSPVIRSVTAVMGRLAISVVRSGILQPEQEDWLTKVGASRSNSENWSLVEISVMQDQIYDQLVHLKNLMERVIESLASDHEQLEHFNSTLDKIDLHETALV